MLLLGGSIAVISANQPPVVSCQTFVQELVQIVQQLEHQSPVLIEGERNTAQDNKHSVKMMSQSGNTEVNTYT